jgi:hypothetical protein
MKKLNSAGSSVLARYAPNYDFAIFRSDGMSFALLTLTRTLCSPGSESPEREQGLSICFSFSRTAEMLLDEKLVVVLKNPSSEKTILRSQVEFIADELALRLLKNERMARSYECDGKHFKSL